MLVSSEQVYVGISFKYSSCIYGTHMNGYNIYYFDVFNVASQPLTRFEGSAYKYINYFI